MIVPSGLIWSSSNWQTTRTGIKSWTSSISELQSYIPLRKCGHNTITLFLIGSSSNLQVTKTGVKSPSSNSGHIGPFTLELPALERICFEHLALICWKNPFWACWLSGERLLSFYLFFFFNYLNKKSHYCTRLSCNCSFIMIPIIVLSKSTKAVFHTYSRIFL